MKKLNVKSTWLPVILSAVLIISVTAVYSADKVKALTAEYLISGSWGPENWLGMKIKFGSDGKFESSIDYGQTGTDLSGSYTVTNGKLTLKIENSNLDKSIIGLVIKDGKPGYDPASLKYRNYISFTDKEIERLYIKGRDLRIWDHNSLIKEGEPVRVHSIDAIAMSARKGVNTSVLKMREAPSQNSRELQYTYEDIDKTYTVKALPVNTALTILARTKEKEKIGKWNNYWYYVEFETYLDYMRAWVYGEFVKIE